MKKKTTKAAAVLIPPSNIWEPIQGIRTQYDRHQPRWMPHINLLYPFVPPDHFPDAAVKIKKVLHDFEPFEITMKDISYFRHREDAFTFWLKPEPVAGVKALHKKLLDVFPECDDTANFDDGYTPHLTLGQNYYSETMTQNQVGQLQSNWEPLRWTANRIYLIWRNDLPDDEFRIGEEIRF